MISAARMRILPVALTRQAFTPFGEVIETDGSRHFTINDGCAERYHDLARLDVNEQGGRPLVNIFNAKPRAFPLRIHMMERHPLSSQLFVPLAAVPFLVVVAPASERPRPEDLRAFMTNGSQGVNYRRGTWHHPLIALATGDFLVIDRDGPGDACDEMRFDTAEILLDAPIQPDGPSALPQAGSSARAPDIVEAILDGRQPAEMTLAVLMEPFPVGWREQLESGFRRP